MFIKLYTQSKEEPIYINPDYIVAVRDVSIFDTHYCVVDVCIPYVRSNRGDYDGLVSYEVLGTASHVIDLICS